MTAHPAPGDITIGGALAIDGHGTAVPAQGETIIPGHTYGSVSNLILSLTAVVWSASQGQYVLQTFERSDPAIQPLLAHLGRTFVTEVTLQVGANTRLRCQSFVNVPASALFGAPGSSSQTFDSYVEKSGRVETIWFPFTSEPWLKVWTVAPQKPLLSREVGEPYNYVFADVIPETLSGLIKDILEGDVSVTPTFGQAELAIVAAGLLGTLTADIWGWAKDLLLYVKPSTLRVTANGYAVLTSRANIQQVIYDFITFYENQVAAYQAEGNYPMNGPVEIRVTGLDEPGDVHDRLPNDAPAVGIAAAARSTQLERGGVVRHPHDARNAVLGSVLPRPWNSGCSLTTSARMLRSVPNGPRDGHTPTRRLGPTLPC